jgi:N utilization substance protein B
MKSTRHQAREVALQILYRLDTGSQPEPKPLNVEAVITELNQHFDHFRVPLELRNFAAELVAGTLRELPQLDGLLEKHASNWKIGRMGIVDRNLLRMAIFELRHFPDTPASVVIDEAIELAKEFGTEESPSFINGVLDAVKNAVTCVP